MLEWLARGFHAAVQAERLMAGRNKALKDEVFVAALLFACRDMGVLELSRYSSC